MPISKAPYTRGHKQSTSRGHQSTVFCNFCGRKLPRHKALVTRRGFRITDPLLKRELDRSQYGFSSEKQYACPACARHRGIVQRKDGKQNARRPPPRRHF